MNSCAATCRQAREGSEGCRLRDGVKRRHERLLRLGKTVRERDFELTEEQILALERFQSSTGSGTSK